MKKNILYLSFLCLASLANAQVGIGTTTPSSTFETRGSIEGNFREITTATNTIATDDYHISFSGTANGTLNLPSQSTIDNSSNDFRGRKYYIKNNSSSHTLTLSALSGQVIRYGGGATSSQTYTLAPGNYATLTASNNGWDLDYVSTTAIAKNWQLYDTSLDGYINGSNSQYITTPSGTYTTLNKPNDTGNPDVAVSVSVPSLTEYANNRVVVSFIGWGDALVSSSDRGSLRFRININGTSTSTVMMTSWATPVSTPNGIRYNFPINYVLNNVLPGNYTYKLEVTREEESTTPTSVRVWTLQGKAEVYVKK